MRSSGSMWQVLSHVSCCLLMFGLVERFIALSKRLFGLTRSALLTLHIRVALTDGSRWRTSMQSHYRHSHGSISNVSCFGIYMSLYFAHRFHFISTCRRTAPGVEGKKSFPRKSVKFFGTAELNSTESKANSQ